MRQFINKLYTDIYSFKHKNMYAQKKIYKQNSIASLIKKRSNATSNRMRSSPPVIDKLLQCKQKLDLFNRIITNENLHTSNIEEIVDNSKLSSSSSSSTSSKKKRKSKNKASTSASVKVKKESTTTKKKCKKVTFKEEEEEEEDNDSDDPLVKELEEIFGGLEKAKPDDTNDNENEEELKQQQQEEEEDVEDEDVYINDDEKEEDDNNNNNNNSKKGNNNKNKLQNNVKTLLKISSDIYETCINMCKKHVRQCEDLIERNKRNELVIEEQDHKLAIIEKSILNQFRSLYDGVIRIDTPYIHSRRDMMTNDISINPFK